MVFRAARREISDDLEEVQELFYQQGWTDGLPIIPPTVQRVERFLKAAGWSPELQLGTLAPSGGTVSAELLCINAVMAGAKPAHLVALAAAVEALSNPGFNLEAIQTTTHPVAPLMIFNGPIRTSAGLNSGAGLFGPGRQANATIGRAIRLLLINVGGAAVGSIDQATQGGPSKYAFCIAENEEQSPWAPLHEERGLAASASAVTLFAGESPHNINDHRSVKATDLLRTISNTIASPGCNNILIGGEVLLILGPEHAQLLARGGVSKRDVQRYIFENATVDIERTAPPCREIMRPAGSGKFQIVDDPDKVVVIVGGGSGKHSAWMPTFSATTKSVTVDIASQIALSDCDDACAVPAALPQT